MFDYEANPIVVGNAIAQQAGMALTNEQGVRRNELLDAGKSLDEALRIIAEEWIRSTEGEQWILDHLDTLSVDHNQGPDAP